jgi:hypothetical protein
MPVLNRQMYISYTDLVDAAPFPVRYAYLCWVTDEPDTERTEMPALPEPISGQVALLGVVEIVLRSPNLNPATSFTGPSFTQEIPNVPIAGGIEPAIVGDAEPAVAGTTFLCSEGGWFGRVNSAGTVLPIQGYVYTWLRDGEPIVSEEPIVGNSYTATAEDEGSVISCEVFAITFGEAQSVTSHITNGIAVTA